MSQFHCRSPGIRVALLFLLLLSLFSSCFQQDSPPDMLRERMLREQAERSYQETQQELLSSRFCNGLLLGITVAASLLFLMIGTALGSSAREDSRQYRKEVILYDLPGRQPPKKNSKKKETPTPR